MKPLLAVSAAMFSLALPLPGQASATAPMNPEAKALVTMAVQAELQANRTDHTPFMYRDHDVTPDHDTLDYVVETPEGNLKRRLDNGGHPLTPEQSAADLQAVRDLMHSDDRMERQRKDNAHYDEQAEVMLKLLPVAFIWTFASERPGGALPGEAGDSVTLNFRPDPTFAPPNMEARVLSQMAGQIIVSRPQNRISTIRGSLTQDVKFGFGILGKVRQGGSFNVERREVVPHHWQVTQSHVHINGKAVFFKSIGDQEDEVRSDFKPSTATTLAQAYAVLEQNKP